MIELFLGGIVFFLSFLLTGLLRGYAIKFRLLDIPNARSSHDVPTPRGGGIGIVISFLMTMLYLYVVDDLQQTEFYALFVGGLLIAALGFWDDHRPIPARWRILVHFSAASWGLFLIGYFPDLNVGGDIRLINWIGSVLAVIFLVWLLNFYNFMDGIDGIAAIETISVAGGAALIVFLNDGAKAAFPLIILSLSCLGFLIWNWPPARIFMGDAGSGFLGFVLGIFAFQTALSEGMSLWVWLILLAVFFVDATVTLVRRICSGERFYEAHRSHAYQRLSLNIQLKNILNGVPHDISRARGHRFVTLCVAVINFFWLFPLAWIVYLRPNWGGYLTAVAMTPLVVLAVKLGAGKKEV
ncbi:MAG: glycosyltransferase family 4 protein [Thermodesulfobacteriota bacterium]